jgi:hypothetical protein
MQGKPATCPYQKKIPAGVLALKKSSNQKISSAI